MYGHELGCEESWALKNWCYWTVVLEKILESPLDCKRSNQSILKEISPGCFLEGMMLKLKLQYFGHLPHVKSWLIGRISDAGRDWGQEEKGTTEDEMARWHHRLNGCEFEWTPGVGDGQGGLACCESWGRKESDRTEKLNWTELRPQLFIFVSGSIIMGDGSKIILKFTSLGNTFLSWNKENPNISVLNIHVHCTINATHECLKSYFQEK